VGAAGQAGLDTGPDTLGHDGWRQRPAGNLAHPIPVLIVYATVVAPEDGLVYFCDDIYRHDAALDQVLAKGYPDPW
jgi:hypothetical protein